MNRAEGTGAPKAFTFISVSRAGSSATGSPPMAIAITQVPVETTENGGWCAKRCGSSEALESWMPHNTFVPGGSPVRVAISGRIGPSTSPGMRTGASLPAIPSVVTSDDGARATGFHKSVWHPSEVTSAPAIPVSRRPQYWG